MASGPARALLIGAWFVVVGAVAGGAAYLESLGPLPGPPVLASPEPAPEPQAPTHLEAPDLQAVGEQPAAAEPAESEDHAEPPPVAAADEADAGAPDADMAMLGAYDLPELPHPPETSDHDASQAPIDLAAEQLESLGGGGGSDAAEPAEAHGDAMPTLAEMTGQGEPAPEPEHFQPQTAWPVETPSLHGPMPMMPRQGVDLAALDDDHQQASQESTPPVLAPPAAVPDTAEHGDEPMPAVPEAPAHPAEAPDSVAQDDPGAGDHGAAPEPDPHQTMVQDGDDAPPELETSELETPQTATAETAADAQPGHEVADEHEPPMQVLTGQEPAVQEPEVHETAPAVAEAHEQQQQEPVETVGAAGLSTEPDDRVVEVAEVGPLPVVGPGGARPAEVYARPFDVPGNRPVVAVVVGGLGLSSAATEAAIQSLPAAVTLSFSPYSGRLQDWVALARAAGHEVLIDLPMEPVDFPHSDPGPQALMTSLNADANMQRLEWVLSRATNYIGVGSYMGSRFAADAAAMRPVLQAINARGLIYLDNGQAIGDVAPTLSAEIGLPLLVSDMEVDQMAARQVIDDALARLETMAQRDGAALAIGTAYPVTIERLSVWTRGLADRGFALAPASALVTR